MISNINHEEENCNDMKNRLIHAFVILAFVTLAMPCLGKTTSFIKLPSADLIDSIIVTSTGKVVEYSDKDWVEYFISEASVTTQTDRVSVQDVPNVSGSVKVDIVCGDSISTLYLYTENGICYIEQPYQGIYKSDVCFYEKIMNKINKTIGVAAEDIFLTKKDIVQFDSLFNAWEIEIDRNLETRLSSNTRTYTTLPQFKELKAMGRKIIPCIIEKFEKDESAFFALPLYDELQDNDSLKSHSKTSEQEKVKEVVQKFRKQERKEMWEEANRCKASITSTTFLKTRGAMSYAVIDALTGQGFNKDYAFNQVVYLEALQRAQKHLSIVEGRLVCDLKSGAEIYVSEDLFLFIIDLFKDWNTWLESGRYEITKDEKGLYTVQPKKTNQFKTNSIDNASSNSSPKYDFNIIKKE